MKDKVAYGFYLHPYILPISPPSIPLHHHSPTASQRQASAFTHYTFPYSVHNERPGSFRFLSSPIYPPFPKSLEDTHRQRRSGKLRILLEQPRHLVRDLRLLLRTRMIIFGPRSLISHASLLLVQVIQTHDKVQFALFRYCRL